MAAILFATLGQRPEAITVGVDLLRHRIDLSKLVILHTEPTHSGIAAALKSLKPILQQDYPDLPVRFHELRASDEMALFDIVDQVTAEEYFRAVYWALEERKQEGFPLHLLIAGGRKAMSIYATLAASFVFQSMDRVWTVLSPSEMMKPGLFHLPVGSQDRAQLVALPLLSAGLTPDELNALPENDPRRIINNRPVLRTRFLSLLTTRERDVVTMLAQHPYASDKVLAALLDKSYRTVQHQLQAIYAKLEVFFAGDPHLQDKRRLLIDLMQGRLEGS